MPKTKLTEKFSRKAPPIDWLRAAILERQAVLGYDLKQLAGVGGISYDSMRHYIRMSPWNWPPALREKICSALGLTPVMSVEGAPVSSSVGGTANVR